MKISTKVVTFALSVVNLSLNYAEGCEKKWVGASCSKSSDCCETCCPNGKCCKSGARRLLGEMASYSAPTSSFQDEKECFGVAYFLAVDVGNHIAFLGMPHDEFCKPVILHDKSEGKAVVFIDKTAQDHEYQDFQAHWDESFLIESYSLSELEQAFEVAESVSVQGHSFDILHHNCATFVLSMLKNLDYKIGPDLLDYAIGQLARSSVSTWIREGNSTHALGTDIDPNDDLALMDRLVHFFVSRH